MDREMIEYGGPLEPGFSRETLIECTIRTIWIEAVLVAIGRYASP